MKKIYILTLITSVFIFIGCSGSDTYRGNWKAMNTKGEKIEIIFEENNLILIDELKDSIKYGYTQNSIKTENSIETYGIKLDDGRGYQINFPIADDESIGLIKDENNNILYSISREKHINPNDIYKLN